MTVSQGLLKVTIVACFVLAMLLGENYIRHSKGSACLGTLSSALVLLFQSHAAFRALLSVLSLSCRNVTGLLVL